MKVPKIPEEKLRLLVPVITEAVVWMAVLGNLQLALRHPENNGPSSSYAKQFGKQILEKLVSEQVLTLEEGKLAFKDFMA
jgi:hypothetical protein